MTSSELAHGPVWKLPLKLILLKDSFLHLCSRTSRKNLHISLKIAEQHCALSFLLLSGPV